MKENNPINSEQGGPTKQDLMLHEDYYINDGGQWVFTSSYHLKRGYCCDNGCKHCPYRNENEL